MGYVTCIEGVYDPQNALVTDDQQRLAVALHLDDDRLQTRDHIQVTLASINTKPCNARNKKNPVHVNT
jgi:hypothetical protein